MKKLFLLLISILAFAKVDDFNVATWNLQGSSAATESKWNVSVRQLISGDNPADILMVQEAGSLPSSARRTGRVVQPGGTPVEEFIWELGTSTRPRTVFIYYAPLDVGARRVNLAIVSNQRADEVLVVHQSSIMSENARPALGIRIGNDYFFNIHALANGGADANALVSAIHDSVPVGSNFLIAGDFNREPADLQSGMDRRIQSDVNIISPRTPTHASASGNHRILDYAIAGINQAGTTSLPTLLALLISAGVRSYLASDHFPVHFKKF